MNYDTMSLRNIFTARVLEFLEETQMPGYLLGRRAVGDNKFWADFLKGERVRIDTMEKIERFMAAERARIAQVTAMMRADDVEDLQEAA